MFHLRPIMLSYALDHDNPRAAIAALTEALSQINKAAVHLHDGNQAHWTQVSELFGAVFDARKALEDAL